MRLYQSIYETALRNNVPNPVIEEMIRIYSYDVDFQRKVQPGDSFDILYSGDENGEGRNDVRYASLTVGGETKKLLSLSDGRRRRLRLLRRDRQEREEVSGAQAGRASASCVRASASAIIRCSHYMKMHTGVDWAAPIGTPIFAAGNGAIDEIGGQRRLRQICARPACQRLQTAYGHMTAFARGLNVGSHVRQGQVIGFVGSTGLSTGAHVHYEILVNDRFVDPMRIKLPRGRVLEGLPLAMFEKDRDQLDSADRTHAGARGSGALTGTDCRVRLPGPRRAPLSADAPGCSHSWRPPRRPC